MTKKSSLARTKFFPLVSSFHLVSRLSIRGTIRLNERTKSRDGKTFIVEEVKNDRKTNDGKKVSLRSYLISATGIRF